MNSIPATAQLPALDPARLLLPLAGCKVPAGFPSPADDFAVKRLDLNELLITHPEATFFCIAGGLSMVPAGIPDRAILLVNRALIPEHDSIVLAEVDGEFTVKKLYMRSGKMKLVAADPTYPEIRPKDGQTLRIVGVVTDAIIRFKTRTQRKAR